MSFSRNAFTLVEIMIVIAIIGILFMVVSVPYGYYTERARVQDAKNQIEQLWTLAHQTARNGSVITGTENANLLLVITKDAKTINLYSVPLTVNLETLRNTSIFPTGEMQLRDSVRLDPLLIKSIEEDGTTMNHASYFIESPNGTGTFLENPDISRIVVTVGYENGSLESGRAREIQLFRQ